MQLAPSAKSVHEHLIATIVELGRWVSSSRVARGTIVELTVGASKDHDYFSKGIIIYAFCFFLGYKTLFQLAYLDKFSALWCWAAALIVVHIIAFICCIVACTPLKPRALASYVCAVFLIFGLQYFSPDPLMVHLRVHFWLHKSEYLARVSATQPSRDGRLSIVLYRYTEYIPAMPGGYLCSTEIVFDNSNDIGLIATTEEGIGSARKVDDNFYFRSPPCG